MSAPFDQFYGRVAPLHTVGIHGVDYAWIYQVPPSVAQPRPADFGPAIHLRGIDSGSTAQSERQRAFKLFWETRAAPAADYTLFVHVLGPDGQRYVQLDLPYPTSHWRPGGYVTTDLPLTLPTGAPSGTYQVMIGLYDPSNGQRLRLTTPTGVVSAIDGPDALAVAHITVK
jgi:hypothetical protein